MANERAVTRQLRPGQATEYLSFLSEAAQEISSSLNYSATLKNVANAMVPSLSDWCAVDIMQEDGLLKRLAIAHVDPKQIKMALELSRKYPRDPKSASGSPHVLNTGESEMSNGITDDMLAAAALNDEHLQMMRDLNFYSLMIVPIKSRRRILGTITLVWAESKNVYTVADLAFAETLAAIAGSAIDNARLYKAAKQSVYVRR
jgi:GAF domain-containing protein